MPTNTADTVDFYRQFTEEERAAFHAKRIALRDQIKELAGHQVLAKETLRQPHHEVFKVGPIMAHAHWRAKRITDLLREYHVHRRTGKEAAHHVA
jgi:hypothetical protein